MSITSITTYRARREAAKQCHPSAYRTMPVVRVWDQSDAITTAQDFHDWAKEAEHGAAVDEPTRWRSVSRPRRAGRIEAFATALAILLAAITAYTLAVLLAPGARADTDGTALQWAATESNAASVCLTLDNHDSLLGLEATVLAVENLGLTAEQAGEAIAISVLEVCPRHTPLLRQFVLKYGPKTA